MGLGAHPAEGSEGQWASTSLCPCKPRHRRARKEPFSCPVTKVVTTGKLGDRGTPSFSILVSTIIFLFKSMPQKASKTSVREPFEDLQLFPK